MRAPLIEVLFFHGCPHVELAVERAQAALRAEGLPVDDDVVLVEIGSDEEAVRRHFTGSPTVRVRSEDVEDVDGREFALQCRLYVHDGGVEGAPPVDWIITAVRGERAGRAARDVSGARCCLAQEGSGKGPR